MDHDIADDDVAQIQDRMQHGTRFPFLAAGIGVEIDGAPQLGLGGVGAQLGRHAGPHEAQNAAHEQLHDPHERADQPN